MSWIVGILGDVRGYRWRLGAGWWGRCGCCRVQIAFLFGWLASWLDLHLIGVRKSLAVLEKRVLTDFHVFLRSACRVFVSICIPISPKSKNSF
jgi:hypothetical protein